MRIDLMQLEFVDITLRKIATWLEDSTGLEFIVTSLYRMGDPGVHGQLPLWAIDLRMRDWDIGREIETHVNFTWEYDPERQNMQCAVLHDAGFGLHLHLQSHPHTRRRA